MPVLRGCHCHMKELTVTQLAGAFCLICIGCTFLSIRADIVELPRLSVETRDLILQQITSERSELNSQMGLLRVETLAEVDSQADKLQGELHRSVDLTNNQISDLQYNSFEAIDNIAKIASAKGDTALAAMVELENKLDPSITNLNSITGDIMEAVPYFSKCYFTDEKNNILGPNPDCIWNRYVGSAKAFEQAARDVSAMSGEFKKSAPQMIATFTKIETHIDDGTKSGAEASAATAKAMANLSIATKPLPAWLRVVLGVGPPVAQAGAAAAAAGAALGWFK